MATNCIFIHKGSVVGIKIPRDLCVTGPDLTSQEADRALKLWANRSQDFEADYKFHDYIWGHNLKLSFAHHVTQKTALDYYGIDIPTDLSVNMPDYTDQKIREVLKRFSMVCKKNVSDSEHLQAVLDYSEFIRLHNIRIEKLSPEERRGGTI